MAQQTSFSVPNLIGLPAVQPRQRDAHPPYPERAVSSEDVEEDQHSFEISRKAFFTLSGYLKVADWALGSTAYLSVAYLTVFAGFATFNTHFPGVFPNVALPLRPLYWSLYVCPYALAFHYYCRFADLSEKYFQAGVTYNCLYRRAKAVKSATDDTERRKAWQEMAKLRDEWEGRDSHWIPDVFQKWIKKSVEEERTKKKKKIAEASAQAAPAPTLRKRGGIS